MRHGRTYHEKDISTSKIAECERDDLRVDFDALVQRRRYMNRLEIEPLQVFKRCVPDDIAAALETLEANEFWKDCVNKTNGNQWVTLALCKPRHAKSAIADVRFECAEKLPAVYFKYCDSRLVPSDFPEYSLMLEYCRNQHRVEQENNLTIEIIREFLGTCNTWGQTVRVWPSFTNYIIHEGKRAKVEKQTKVSPLPYPLKDDPQKLSIMHKRIAFAEQVLVQALLLPDRKRATPSWHYDTNYYEDDVSVFVTL